MAARAKLAVDEVLGRDSGGGWVVREGWVVRGALGAHACGVRFDRGLCRGNVLLVDEIDTGLHYSVMVDTWRMVHRATARLGVQVFATTHSRDCVEALAALAEEISEEADITIQRVERDEDEAVAYTQAEIISAAKRGIEIR